jgi:phage/plasmid-associated DNA primase
LSRGGLDAPAAVLKATAEYKNSSDQVSIFLGATTVRSATATVLYSRLYERYKTWTDETGETYTMSERDFKKCLVERGVGSRHTKHGMVWEGFELLAQNNNEQSVGQSFQEEDQIELPI